MQLDGGARAAAGGVASISDSGNTSSIMPAKNESEVCQEKLSISPWASGENKNCPNEPAAVPPPNANERQLSGNELAERADHHRNEQPARPKPMITPAERSSISGDCAVAIPTSPSA